MCIPASACSDAVESERCERYVPACMQTPAQETPKGNYACEPKQRTQTGHMNIASVTIKIETPLLSVTSTHGKKKQIMQICDFFVGLRSSFLSLVGNRTEAAGSLQTDKGVATQPEPCSKCSPRLEFKVRFKKIFRSKLSPKTFRPKLSPKTLLAPKPLTISINPKP